MLASNNLNTGMPCMRSYKTKGIVKYRLLIIKTITEMALELQNILAPLTL